MRHVESNSDLSTFTRRRWYFALLLNSCIVIPLIVIAIVRASRSSEFLTMIGFALGLICILCADLAIWRRLRANPKTPSDTRLKGDLILRKRYAEATRRNAALGAMLLPVAVIAYILIKRSVSADILMSATVIWVILIVSIAWSHRTIRMVSMREKTINSGGHDGRDEMGKGLNGT